MARARVGSATKPNAIVSAAVAAVRALPPRKVAMRRDISCALALVITLWAN